MDLEPHHDAEVYVDVLGARAHQGKLNTLIHPEVQVSDLHLVGYTIELRSALVVRLQAVIVIGHAFVGSLEAVLTDELLK